MSAKKETKKANLSLDEFFEVVKDEVVVLHLNAGDYVFLEDVEIEAVRTAKNGNRVVDIVGRVAQTNTSVMPGQMVRFTTSIANAMEVATSLKQGMRYILIKKGDRVYVNGYTELPRKAQ
jgi:translation initiation factor IF-1